ncbi:flagellar hook-basal body complex protein FliE [Pseudobacteriovorax antillogorgiicola]|uniref:Flagellar hook-basal body complex protein FliE n=1 Tax=Pseudobacteriovorax antillogorgiicola TaxID=1513793 RepID=A0A1Y6CJ72_9BACT|nr:flagellar hook-basal body complex protein FliE [Pseudobacteriovorax antillogorgiicola]TCS46114.1 flagellar hook-basal body complex protein FliE [Pseudobacteriovorax antillogorgiicola]SMF69477.1 flagellar hook-basal body complex protein FliE [Pseudobacteriovorax antillogorgiicola]
MMTINSRSSSRFGEQLLAELREFQSINREKAAGNVEAKPKGPTFIEHLENSVTQVNKDQKFADKAATDLATGKSQNIHETMLAVTQAELTFNMAVQVRNKALEAYQEVMRMPV